VNAQELLSYVTQKQRESFTTTSEKRDKESFRIGISGPPGAGMIGSILLIIQSLYSNTLYVCT
jgi:putative protein kinase ArgK-like GTPase of G3E family